jgi:hypothetical protein
MSVPDVLGRIDWNFPRAGTAGRSVHSVHWFPGNFIPQIPVALIQALSKPGDLVLDPFGGSGTTGIEAIRLGRNAILSDRILPCVLISQAKLDLQLVGLNQEIKSKIIAPLIWRHECHSALFGTRGEGSDPSLAHWFAPGTLSQLRFLWQQIEKQSCWSVRRILTLLFSDVLFACASPGKAVTSTGKRRRHHWGWVADNVYPINSVEYDAIGFFETRVATLPEVALSAKHGSGLVIQQDARRLAVSSDSVDLIVTSPPYVSVIDYARANRLLYAWMNWPLEADRSSEIGARYKRRRQSAVSEYIEDMRTCWEEMHRVLRPEGYCAVVIGESRRFAGTVDRTIDDLSRLMRLVWGPISRTSTRRRVSDREAKQAVEYLYVFRKS